MKRLPIMIVFLSLGCSVQFECSSKSKDIVDDSKEYAINFNNSNNLMKCTTTFGHPKIEALIHPKSCKVSKHKDYTRLDCTKIEYRNEDKITIDTRDPRGWWCIEL